MILVDIPGWGQLKASHLVLDYNGTLACDGNLLDGVWETLNSLSDKLKIHVITADTFGKVRSGMEGVSCEVHVLPLEGQDVAKENYVRSLGAGETVAVGNGRNDRLMLREAALGIAVILGEGAAREAIQSADVICVGILSALNLLENPLRLTATLRS